MMSAGPSFAESTVQGKYLNRAVRSESSKAIRAKAVDRLLGAVKQFMKRAWKHWMQLNPM